MRAWKNKRGLCAYVAVAALALTHTASWAKIEPTMESGSPPMPSEEVNPKTPPIMMEGPLKPPGFGPTMPTGAEPDPKLMPPGFDALPMKPMGDEAPRGMPPMGGEPPRGMPPTSGEPPRGMPPTSGEPPRGIPPTSGEPPRGIPPANGEAPRGMPPLGGNPNDMKGQRPVRRDLGRPPMIGNHRDRMPPAAAQRGKLSPAVNDPEILNVVPQKCTPATSEFIWNFEEEELINILRQVSDLMCRTIVVNDALGKNLKMTIIGKSLIKPRDAWDVLSASLASKGLSLIEQGKTYTLVKRNESKSYATPMYGHGRQAKNNEEIGTLFYKAQHAPMDVLKNVSKALISKDGLVDSVGDQFVLVIDSNSNIKRLGSIFAQVDIADAQNKVQPIILQHADVKTVEKHLRDLFDIPAGGQRSRRPRTGPQGAGETRSLIDVEKIVADERSNSLIVIADKEAMEKLREVVALVDQPASDKNSKGKIQVTPLRHADAKKVAETLTAVVSQGQKGRFGGGPRRGGEGTSELFEGEVKITAHESTNALVTVASANDYLALLSTINKLDEPRQQVYVEAVILDIEVKDSSGFGINLFSGMQANIPGTGGTSLGMMANPGGKGIVEGIKNSVASSATGANVSGLGENSIGALAVLGNFLSGGVAGIVGPRISGTDIPSFGAVLQALSENASVDVLSTPYLLTTDNQQAEMSVGDKIPVIRGASALGSSNLAAGLGVLSQNVQHEDVKLTFKVTPHVGADRNVRLDIEQEVNELGSITKIMNQDQYNIRTKSAKTTLVLKDQQTGVIGGLIHHSTTRTDNKVPFLGDIPILGWLFKTRASKNDRRSLLLIITPYVISSDEDYRRILDRKLKEREEFARLYYGGKIRNYNPHIEYNKKAGPLSSMLLSVDEEMNKTENGGLSDGSDVVITPKDAGLETGASSFPKISISTPAIDETVGAESFEGELPSGSLPFEELVPEEDVLPKNKAVASEPLGG